MQQSAFHAHLAKIYFLANVWPAQMPTVQAVNTIINFVSHAKQDTPQLKGFVKLVLRTANNVMWQALDIAMLECVFLAIPELELMSVLNVCSDVLLVYPQKFQHAYHVQPELMLLVALFVSSVLLDVVLVPQNLFVLAAWQDIHSQITTALLVVHSLAPLVIQT